MPCQSWTRSNLRPACFSSAGMPRGFGLLMPHSAPHVGTSRSPRWHDPDGLALGGVAPAVAGGRDDVTTLPDVSPVGSFCPLARLDRDGLRAAWPLGTSVLSVTPAATQTHAVIDAIMIVRRRRVRRPFSSKPDMGQT